MRMNCLCRRFLMTKTSDFFVGSPWKQIVAIQPRHRNPKTGKRTKKSSTRLLFHRLFQPINKTSQSGRVNILSTGAFSKRAIFIASSNVGLYLLFSMALIVCRVTPSFSARSSCRSPIAFRRSLMSFSILFTREEIEKRTESN